MVNKFCGEATNLSSLVTLSSHLEFTALSPHTNEGSNRGVKLPHLPAFRFVVTAKLFCRSHETSFYSLFHFSCCSSIKLSLIDSRFITVFTQNIRVFGTVGVFRRQLFLNSSFVLSAVPVGSFTDREPSNVPYFPNRIITMRTG